MTNIEAESWLDQMGREKAIQMVLEYHQLKQHLCAQRLSVPTGCADWVQRAVERTRHLCECEHQLRLIIDKGSALLLDAKWKTKHRACVNCRGTGRVNEESCVMCRGTGDSP